jgi:hypothetical protein
MQIRVRRNAKRGDAIVYMDVDVNQSWRNDHAPRVEHLARLGFRDSIRNARNFALADCHIGIFREALGWIDDATAADEEIVGWGTASLGSEQRRGLVIELAHQGRQENGAAQELPPILDWHEY